MTESSHPKIPLFPPLSKGDERGISSSRLAPRASRLHDLDQATLDHLDQLAELLRQSKIRNRKSKIELAARLGWSLSTLERKIKALERDGLAGLLRRQRNDKGRARVADQKIVAKIKIEFLQTHRPAASHVHQQIAKDYELSGLKAPSYSFVLRKTKEIDPDVIAQARYGERNFDDKFALITLRKKPALPRQWCDSDHHILDHIVVFADGSIGRPWLTAIQDICTNEILGYVLSREKKSTYPGANAIGLCLRNAILRKSEIPLNPPLAKGEIGGFEKSAPWPSFGLFDNFYSDLGRDFRGSYIRAVCNDLGIRTVFARGYHGKSKPIERWFGVLENGIKHLPGYIGRSPETNPLKQEIGAPRQWEDLRGEIMSIDEFAAALHDWIVNVFHHADSRALRGLSPMDELERHVKNGWAPREIKDERALDLLLMHRRAKKVQRFGIEMFGSAGAQRFFMAPELAGLVGQDVEVFYDPAKIGELIIYRNNRFLCKAQNRQLLDFGASEEDLAREREIKRMQKESIRKRIDELAARAQYPNELARAQAETRREVVMEQEREKIAVNAMPEQRIYKLIPKFQVAAKALRDGSTMGARGNGFRVSSLTPNTSHPTPHADADELKSSADLFKSEKNPWLEEE